MFSLPASKAHIWGSRDGCRAWPSMVAACNLEEQPNEEREKGIAAHELAELVIKGRIDKPADKLNSAMGNGVIVDDEMVYSVRVYLEVVFGHIQKADKYGVEEEIPYEGKHVRVDFWAFYEESGILFVADFKYGHRVVEHVNNPTMLVYSDALWKHKDLRSRDYQFAIIQPRAFHKGGPARLWTPTREEYLEEMEAVKIARIECSDPNPVCRTGEHCTTCEARFNCQALGSAAASAVEYAYSNTVQNLPAACLRLELDLLRRAYGIMKQRITGLETQAEALLRSGQQVPGLRLKQKYSREEYTMTNEEIAAMGDTFGIDLRKPLAISTPNQAIKAGFPKEVMAELTTRHPTTMELSNADIDQNEINLIFGVK